MTAGGEIRIWTIILNNVVIGNFQTFLLHTNSEIDFAFCQFRKEICFNEWCSFSVYDPILNSVFCLESDSRIGVVHTYSHMFVHNAISLQSTFSSMKFLIDQLYSSSAQLFATFKTFCLVLP